MKKTSLMMRSHIESLERHIEMGNTQMAKAEAMGLFGTSSDPVMKLIAIDFLEMIDSVPVDEMLEIVENDPEPMLRRRATEYLAMHADDDPRIIEVLMQMSAIGGEIMY